ncbi:MAG: hypothetical protein FWC60_02895 [Firmicutes bacterium]|nr:hypothetical protein [Bacillota bacterium]
MAKYFSNKLMVCLLPLFLVLIGCGAINQRPVSPAPDNYGAINQRSVSPAPDNSVVKAALFKEFDAIPIMPGALSNNDCHLNEKSISMLIDCSYTTNSSYAEIKDFYDTQLKKLGWQFIGEEKVYDWDRDYGGKFLHYKKGNFTADVQYAGEKANYGWTYAFDIEWELEDSVKNEFALIPIMPNAKEEKRNFTSDGLTASSMSMKAYYTTPSSDQAIKAYYDTQLRAHGWTYDRTEGTASNGQELTGQTIVYRKDNNLTAKLTFATGKNSPNRTYYFTIAPAI